MTENQATEQRFAACIEYCGLHYAGWQRQKNAPSVQEEIEKALGQVADHEVRVVTAGRTDTGVHGIGQVVHFETSSRRSNGNWVRGVNSWLPNDISLIWTHPVSDDFHARFSARQRWYRYVLLNRQMSPSYLHGRVAWHRPALALEPMQRAALELIGQHDFSAFRAAGCQSKNPTKDLRKLEVNQQGAWFWFDVVADGFLQHMVRNLVGVLCRIGNGEEPVSWAGHVLKTRDRRQAGVTFPPGGLYFARVDYDPDFNLQPPPPVCCFW